MCLTNLFFNLLFEIVYNFNFVIKGLITMFFRKLNKECDIFCNFCFTFNLWISYHLSFAEPPLQFTNKRSDMYVTIKITEGIRILWIDHVT
jgi:hypothetical protein